MVKNKIMEEKYKFPEHMKDWTDEQIQEEIERILKKDAEKRLVFFMGDNPVAHNSFHEAMKKAALKYKE